MPRDRQSRKRSQARRRASEPRPVTQSTMGRGYARSRERDEAARADLEPLRPGERPLAVTVGAVAAGLLALANLLALVLGHNFAEDTLSPGSKLTGSVIVTALLVLMAWGMWRARYWAVLGMQTLLALTLVFTSLALITALTLWATALLLIIIAAAGTLFWFLVKAMARIQMPERPGA